MADEQVTKHSRTATWVSVTMLLLLAMALILAVFDPAHLIPDNQQIPGAGLIGTALGLLGKQLLDRL